jgi:hypothetical protein
MQAWWKHAGACGDTDRFSFDMRSWVRAFHPSSSSFRFFDICREASHRKITHGIILFSHINPHASSHQSGSRSRTLACRFFPSQALFRLAISAT